MCDQPPRQAGPCRETAGAASCLRLNFIFGIDHSTRPSPKRPTRSSDPSFSLSSPRIIQAQPRNDVKRKTSKKKKKKEKENFTLHRLIFIFHLSPISSHRANSKNPTLILIPNTSISIHPHRPSMLDARTLQVFSRSEPICIRAPPRFASQAHIPSTRFKHSTAPLTLLLLPTCPTYPVLTSSHRASGNLESRTPTSPPKKPPSARFPFPHTPDRRPFFAFAFAFSLNLSLLFVCVCVS